MGNGGAGKVHNPICCLCAMGKNLEEEINNRTETRGNFSSRSLRQ